MAGKLAQNRLKAVETIVHDLLSERFPSELIRKVVVRPDHDSDGDAVLRVFVVVEADKSVALDVREMAGLVRHMRIKLEAEDLDDFPVVSFVSHKEAGTLLEAA